MKSIVLIVYLLINSGKSSNGHFTTKNNEINNIIFASKPGVDSRIPNTINQKKSMVYNVNNMNNNVINKVTFKSDNNLINLSSSLNLSKRINQELKLIETTTNNHKPVKLGSNVYVNQTDNLSETSIKIKEKNSLTSSTQCHSNNLLLKSSNDIDFGDEHNDSLFEELNDLLEGVDVLNELNENENNKDKIEIVKTKNFEDLEIEDIKPIPMLNFNDNSLYNKLQRKNTNPIKPKKSNKAIKLYRFNKRRIYSKF